MILKDTFFYDKIKECFPKLNQRYSDDYDKINCKQIGKTLLTKNSQFDFHLHLQHMG